MAFQTDNTDTAGKSHKQPEVGNANSYYSPLNTNSLMFWASLLNTNPLSTNRKKSRKSAYVFMNFYSMVYPLKYYV